jgi:hypothetical protein
VRGIAFSLPVMGRGRPRSGQGWGSAGRMLGSQPDPRFPTLLACGELSLPMKGREA